MHLRFAFFQVGASDKAELCSVNPHAVVRLEEATDPAYPDDQMTRIYTMAGTWTTDEGSSEPDNVRVEGSIGSVAKHLENMADDTLFMTHELEDENGEPVQEAPEG